MIEKKCKDCSNTRYTYTCTVCYKHDRWNPIKEDKEKPMNYIPEIAKMLGVEIGEEFNILSNNFNLAFGPWKLVENNLVNSQKDSNNAIIGHLITGRYTIQKLPWKPKHGDIFYYVNELGNIEWYKMSSHSAEYYFYNANNCFKTSEEITLDIIARVLKEMKGPYDEK